MIQMKAKLKGPIFLFLCAFFWGMAFSAQSTEEQAPTEETPAEDDYPEGDPFAEEEPLEATRRINLDDLKFGRNYGGGKD